MCGRPSGLQPDAGQKPGGRPEGLPRKTKWHCVLVRAASALPALRGGRVSA